MKPHKSTVKMFPMRLPTQTKAIRIVKTQAGELTSTQGKPLKI
jgi:hypothetical protein